MSQTGKIEVSQKEDIMYRIQPVQIDWKPDKSSPDAVYAQIVRFVCQKVETGEWPIGTRLPSHRELARLFGVNRGTIGKALDMLNSYGLIKGNRGNGTVIASNTWSVLLPHQADWGSYVSAGYFQANKTVVQEINRLEFSPHMVRLGTGELDPRLFPADMMKEALARVASSTESLGYPEPLGLERLRKAVSRHLEKIGIIAPPSSILITSGALQALQLISASLLEGGSVVYTERPTYLNSLRVFQSAGLRLTGVAMDAQGISMASLQNIVPLSSAKPEAVLYTIPTNHNPTGRTMTADRRYALLKFCANRRLPIIEDGAYQDLSFDAAPPPLKAIDKIGTVIYLGSASKSLAPGLRIGWLVGPEPVVQRLGDVKMQVDYGASSLSQLVMAEFLESGMYDEYNAFLRNELRRRRDAALDVLNKRFRSIASWQVPDGGFYIWLTLKETIHMEFIFRAAAKAGILINPGDIYDFRRNNSLRLSYSYTTPEEFREAALKLADVIEREMRNEK